MGCTQETPAPLHPRARRPAFLPGTGQDAGASGETTPIRVEWLPQGTLDAMHWERADKPDDWLSPLGGLWKKGFHMNLTEDQFVFEWYSGTGKGGQHRNKHQNCCRCIHIETGITANGTGSRSREDNKRAALSVCISRVAAHFHKDKERFQAGNERVRTYNEADNRVYDHASGRAFSWDGVMLKNDFQTVVEERAKAMR